MSERKKRAVIIAPIIGLGLTLTQALPRLIESNRAVDLTLLFAGGMCAGVILCLLFSTVKKSKDNS